MQFSSMIGYTVSVVVSNTGAPANISNYSQSFYADTTKTPIEYYIIFSFVPNESGDWTIRLHDSSNAIVATSPLLVVENRFFYNLPDGRGGEVEAVMQFELDLTVTRGAIVPMRFVQLFDVIDIERTIGHADQEVQSRLIISPTMTLIVELLSQEQSDVANFYLYWRDAVKRVKFYKDNVLVFRGELNIEQLEQQGELSLKIDFDSISVGKLYAKLKKLNGELLTEYEGVLLQYEENFSNTTWYKVSNLFKGLSEFFGFDGFEINQATITGFGVRNYVSPFPAASDLGGTYPLYVAKNTVFGIGSGWFIGNYKIETLADALKVFATWLDLVIHFDANNKCVVRDFWNDANDFLSDDDVLEVKSKQCVSRRVKAVVAAGNKDQNNQLKWFYRRTVSVSTEKVPVQTQYGEITIDPNTNKNPYQPSDVSAAPTDESAVKILRAPFPANIIPDRELSGTGFDWVVPFAIYIPFTQISPYYITINAAKFPFARNQGASPNTYQSFLSLQAISAFRWYRFDRYGITLRVRGTDWQMSKNYQTSMNSRLGEGLLLKPLEIKINDRLGESEITFVEISGQPTNDIA